MYPNILRIAAATVFGIAALHGSTSSANAAPPGTGASGVSGHFPQMQQPGVPFFRPFFAPGYGFGYNYGWRPGSVYSYPYYGLNVPTYNVNLYYTDPGVYQVRQALALSLVEQARAQALANQRRAIEQAPQTLAARAEIEQQLAVGRLAHAQGTPSMQEIRSGRSLNELLVDLQKLGMSNDAGPDLPLDQKSLKKINVTTGAGWDRATLTFLQTERMSWPELFDAQEFKAEREMLGRLADEAVADVIHGSADASKAKDLQTKLHALYERLDAKFPAEAGAAQRRWMEARSFVRRYETAARALQKPEARPYLNGDFAAQGSTVGELVRHMTAKGLRFASDAGNNDSAYRTLHRALADYSLAVHGSLASGYTTPASDPRKLPELALSR